MVISPRPSEVGESKVFIKTRLERLELALAALPLPAQDF
jgi:hypothetical protein